jgi:hypothetical protein
MKMQTVTVTINTGHNYVGKFSIRLTGTSARKGGKRNDDGFGDKEKVIDGIIESRQHNSSL